MAGEPYNYAGLMGLDGQGVTPSIQQTLLGQQNIQQNANVLAKQQQAQDAQRAMSDILLGGGMPGANGIVATREQQAQSEADARRPGLGGEASGEIDINAAWERLARADPEAASMLRQQMQQRQQLSRYLANPTAKGTLELLTTQPSLKEQVTKGWDIYDSAAKQAKLSALADAKGYLDNKDTAGALNIIEQHRAADEAAGLPTDGYGQLKEAVQAGHGLAIANLMLATGAGPEKFAEAYGGIGKEGREQELQPSAVRSAAAKASQEETTAQFAPQTAQSALDTAAAQRQRMAAQTANEQADLAIRRSGLDLERDKLESGIQLELEKLDRNGTQLDAGGRQAVNSAVGESVAASALSDRMNSLADRIHGTDMASGAYSAAREKLKGLFGGQDPVSGLRAEYNQLVNAQAVKNLPPGPASDKDIQLAKQGFPPASANAAYLESFLRGMAKMQAAVAASSDRKANWISTNGSLAPTRRDMDIGGVMVPAGTTFNEFNNNAVKRGRQGQMPAGLSSVLQKYGGR